MIEPCSCGRQKCDCARWERIFREKFEDPDYYKRPLTSLNHQSTLGGNISLGDDLTDRRRGNKDWYQCQ